MLSWRLRGAALTEEVLRRAGRFTRGDLESLYVRPLLIGGVIDLPLLMGGVME